MDEWLHPGKEEKDDNSAQWTVGDIQMLSN